MNDTFGERLKVFRESIGLSAGDLSDKLGVSKQTIWGVESGSRGFSQDVLATLGTIGADLNWLLSGIGDGPAAHFHDSRGREVIGSGDFVMVPLIPQTVSAGPGQELLLKERTPDHNSRSIPAPKKLVNGDYVQALEVRGDSMTGIQIFDGDYVYYCPGEVRGDGVYVIQVHGELLVKRLEFDHFSQKIIIHSENERYPSRAEARDSQAMVILGKVRGWTHVHPY